MSNREFDTLVLGFSLGALIFLWVGYRLRVRVERWHARGARRRDYPTWRDAKSLSFVAPGARPDQSVRRVLKDRPPRIPLRRPPSPSAEVIPVIRYPAETGPTPTPVAPGGSSRELETTRMDVYSALVDAGFRKVDAREAVEACTPEERAGGLESWVAAALRRATSK